MQTTRNQHANNRQTPCKQQANNRQPTRKQQANNKQTTNKQQANNMQTTGKQHANNRQTTSKQQANSRQTTNKQHTNNRQTTGLFACLDGLVWLVVQPETTRRPLAESPQIYQNIEKNKFRNFGIDLGTRKVELRTYLVKASMHTRHNAVWPSKFAASSHSNSRIWCKRWRRGAAAHSIVESCHAQVDSWGVPSH